MQGVRSRAPNNSFTTCIYRVCRSIPGADRLLMSNMLRKRVFPWKLIRYLGCQNHALILKPTNPIFTAGLLLVFLCVGNVARANPVDLPTLDANPSSQIESDLTYSESLLSNYFLGFGDRLHVEIFGFPDYAGDFRVLSDGSVHLALVGNVSVKGLTLQQASDKIAVSYQQYIHQPFVDLDLIELRPIRLVVAGQVNRPGSYALENGVDTDPITLTKAIQMAGGITQRANIREIQVTRSLASANGQMQQADVNLWSLIESGDISQDPLLQDGDVVVIPEADALEIAEATRVAAANFSPESININVVGEVEDPGTVAVPLNAPMNQALLAAGGFTNRAVEGEVELVRLNSNGTISRREIDIDFSQDVNEAFNPILQANDTILVRETGLSQTADRASLILSPLSGIFNLLNLLF